MIDFNGLPALPSISGAPDWLLAAFLIGLLLDWVMTPKRVLLLVGGIALVATAGMFGLPLLLPVATPFLAPLMTVPEEAKELAPMMGAVAMSAMAWAPAVLVGTLGSRIVGNLLRHARFLTLRRRANFMDLPDRAPTEDEMVSLAKARVAAAGRNAPATPRVAGAAVGARSWRI